MLILWLWHHASMSNCTMLANHFLGQPQTNRKGQFSDPCRSANNTVRKLYNNSKQSQWSTDGIFNLRKVYYDPKSTPRQMRRKVYNNLIISSINYHWDLAYILVQTPYRLIYFWRQLQAVKPVQLPAPGGSRSSTTLSRKFRARSFSWFRHWIQLISMSKSLKTWDLGHFTK